MTSMKQFLFLWVLFATFSGCNSNSSQSEAKADTSSTKEQLSYPFTPKYSINWQPGDEKNAQLVLNCLRKYVDGDIKGCASYFADTATFIADKFYFRGSRDSLEKMVGDMRNASASVSKEFDSWATMYYPDKGDTWVTLWYIEKMTDKHGNV